jgi:hypothetical protein
MPSRHQNNAQTGKIIAFRLWQSLINNVLLMLCKKLNYPASDGSQDLVSHYQPTSRNNLWINPIVTQTYR